MSATEERPGVGPGLLMALGFLAMTASLSINMYLPGFTAMSRQLDVPASMVQMTMTSCLVGLALGQLTLGPLSDRFGRRAVLSPSLALYAIAGFAIALSGDIRGVLVFRFVEGFAAAAGMAVPRAIAADRTQGPATVKALSLLATFVAMGPLISPLLGGFIIDRFGWEAVFWFLGGIGVAMWAMSLVVVPETLPKEKRVRGGVLLTYKRFGPLLRDGRFVMLMLSYSFGFTALISFITATPFLAQNILGMTTVQFSLVYAVGAFAMIIAALINASAADRVNPVVMLGVGGGMSVLAGAVLMGFSVTGMLIPAVLVSVAVLFYSSAGFINSNSTALALSRAPRSRGAAAALLGTTQFVIGGMVSPLVGIAGPSSAMPVSVICLVCGAIVFIIAMLLRRQVRG